MNTLKSLERRISDEFMTATLASISDDEGIIQEGLKTTEDVILHAVTSNGYTTITFDTGKQITVRKHYKELSYV